jgi:hypothetical protein
VNVLPLALSISNSFTKAGAIAAFAALVGIAVLSLLVFSQAREIKRLREWAGRAPERAAETEQRVSADAAARLQRGPTPPLAAGARVVPRKTPLVSAPVSTAVNATASAAVPAAGVTPASAAVAATPPAGETPVAADANTTPAVPVAVESKAEEPAPDVFPQTPVPAGEPSTNTEAKPGEQAPTPSEAQGGGGAPLPSPAPSPVASEPANAPESAAPAPATAAAAARSPLPPSPSAPSPAVRRIPSRTVAVVDPPVAAARTTTRPPVGASGPKYFKPERSPARAVVLVVGGLIVVVLALVFAVSALKGGGGSSATSTPTQSSATGEASQSPETRTSTHRAAANPTDTTVTVLNGTGTAGLAHHLASDLQQGGYSQAAASASIPQGTHPTTVVEYTHGHRADAQAVARSLNVTQVQPIESSIAALAGPATVVVLAGADQAALLGGGAAQSQGEPAAAP